MVELLLQQKRVISLYVANHDSLIKLTPQQWSLMKHSVKVLKPFEKNNKNNKLRPLLHIQGDTERCCITKNETTQRIPNLAHMRVSLTSHLDPRFKTKFLGAVDAENSPTGDPIGM